MKRILSTTILAASFALLAACGMNEAHAQTVYKGQNGVPFAIEAADTITGEVGRIVVTYGGLAAGSGSAILDGTGAVYQTLIADPKFLAQFVQVGATTRWVNVARVAYSWCAYPISNIVRPYSTNALAQINDQCMTTNALTAKAVN